MSKLISLIGSLISSVIGISVILKVLLGTFAVVLIPKVIKYVMMNWGSSIVDAAMNMVGDFAGVEYNGLIVEITGFVGYVSSRLRLDDCFTVIVSSTITVFVLSFFRK